MLKALLGDVERIMKLRRCLVKPSNEHSYKMYIVVGMRTLLFITYLNKINSHAHTPDRK
ncbi:MAG: hypothetical protein JWO03_3152 [Bacteroidetes bacterium]|nr:hypothetical protein [Bacteroidota bacterium]